jgi:hypothetical protein
VTQQEAIRVLDLAREGQHLPTEVIELALSVTDQQPRPDQAERYEQFVDALRKAGLL